MATDTATVVTLTAEVRTLIVGSRQVTLSVAKQLDVVRLNDLQVMGRVRIGGDWDMVIGAAPDGTLALARVDVYRAENLAAQPYHVADLPAPITVCNSYGAKGQSRQAKGWLLNFEGYDIHVHANSAQGCGAHNRHSPDHCASWNPNGNAVSIINLISEQRIRRERFIAVNKTAADAPLIVLAGLK